MINVIKAEIYSDGDVYCGKCLEFDVFAQGKTLDETVKTLKDAIAFHLEDKPHNCHKIAPNPPILVMLDLGRIYV